MAARLAVLISGGGTNLQAVLDAIQGGHLPATVEVVISNRRNAFGLTRAERAGIATRYFPLKPYRDQGRTRAEYDADLAHLVKSFAPHFVVLAGWMHILSKSFLEHFPYQVVNLHPALPGKFPGANAIAEAYAAFQRGEIKQTGVMVHLVPDERVDAGPVIDTGEVSIYATDTVETLTTRMHQMEHRVLVRALRRLIEGDDASI